MSAVRGDARMRESIARRVRGIRRDLGLSQAALAERLGVTQASVHNYERGKRDLPLPVAIQIAGLSEVSLDVLVHGKRQGAAA